MQLDQQLDHPVAIKATALARQFGDTAAVAGVDLAVQRGEIYGFLGPNGAGKSTTVRMLTTLLKPTAGTAQVAGHDVITGADKVRLRIGVALQEAALDGKQTGRELLDLQGRLYGLGRVERDRRVSELLELVDIGDAIDRRINTYSGGMKRRLDLAAALVHQPEVLFLDEPTTGLDPTSRAAVWAEVRYLNQQLGMTIFLTTQYLEEADALANRVGIIAHGKLVAEGTPAALKRSIGSDVIVVKVHDEQRARVAQVVEHLAQVERVEIAGDEVMMSVDHGAAAISPVAVALAEAGITVEGLTLRTPTLDDVFLHMTGGRMQEDAA
ncbi:MAG: ATP-binding cassette domain-containing protein [Actinomycetota bacterium]|nr:ATP-binding cassette domain-containing protein [Actinomycetota bacterium]